MNVTELFAKVGLFEGAPEDRVALAKRCAAGARGASSSRAAETL